MSTENKSQVEDVVIDNIDDFLPMPGADSVVTSDEEGDKPSLFSANSKPVNLDFLEKSDDEGESKVDADAALDDLDSTLKTGDDLDDDDEPKKKAGRSKTDKSGLVSFLKKRIENNEMFAFDDYDESKQSLDDYLGNLSEKDVEELWTANVDNLKQEVAAKTPKEFLKLYLKNYNMLQNMLQKEDKI